MHTACENIDSGPALHRDQVVPADQADSIEQLAWTLRELSASAFLQAELLRHGADPRWEDDVYLYMEAVVVDRDLDVDLSLSGTQAFFRIRA
jgi:hypothetical protein